MTYPVKLSRGMLGLLWFMSVLIVGIALKMIYTPTGPISSAAPLGFVLILLIPASWALTLPQRIVLGNGKLKVCHGIVTAINLEFSQITRVFSNRDRAAGMLVGSQPGWRVQHAQGEVLLTPTDEEGFFEELARQCPHLRQYGLELRSDPILPEPKK